MLTVERKRKIAVILLFSQNNLVLEKTSLNFYHKVAAKASKIKAGLHFTLDTATPYNQWSTSGIVKKDKEFLKCLAKKHSEFKTSKITPAGEI